MTQIHWLNPVTASFSTAADWSTGTVPGANDGVILDAPGATPYRVYTTANETVASIQTAANATLDIGSTGGANPVGTSFTAVNGTGAGINAGTIAIYNACALNIAGVFDNSGTISLNYDYFRTPLGHPRLSLDGNATFTGGGTILFNGEESRYPTVGIYGNGINLTNFDDTIYGNGNIIARTFVNDAKGIVNYADIGAQTLVNLGTIKASYHILCKYLSNFGTIISTFGPLDISTIYYPGVTATNTGVIEAAGYGAIKIEATIDNSSGGVISANGGRVAIDDGTIIGGTLESSSGGFFATSFNPYPNGPGAVLDGRTSKVNDATQFHIIYGASLTIEGAISNSGQIQFDNSGKTTDLIIGTGGATLSGGGAVTLDDSRHDRISGVAATDTLINVDNTISGEGLVGLGSLTLVNQSAGVIDANGATALTVDTAGEVLVNGGLMEASGKGGLFILGTTVDQSSGGTIAGAGGPVWLEGADIIGGTLRSSGAGVIHALSGANVLDGTTSAVTNQGTVIIVDGQSLTIQGAILNAGEIGFAGAGHGTSLIVGVASASLSGRGELVLNNEAGNMITGAASAATLTNVDNVITGAGSLGAGRLTLVNEAKGVIIGSHALALVIDTGPNTIVNAGVILARSAGGVTIQSAVANSGLLEADGGVLTVNGEVSGTGAGVIYAGTLDFTSGFSQKVVFQRTTGVLELAQSQSYAGAVFGFSKTGGTSLDLRDIGFVSSAEATFSGTASGGVLSVTDGTHTAHITLRGDYRASTFTASSDGHGGVIVVDPKSPRAAPHQFIAAAASLGAGGGGAMNLTLDAWRAHPPMLTRPGMMVS